MAIGIILFIVLVAVTAGFVAWGVTADGVSAGVAWVLAILSVIALLIVPFSFHTVNSGEVAVVKQLGKVLEEEKTAGTHFDFWITKSYNKYDTTVQTLDLTFSAYSADAQTMDVAMTLQYQIIPDRAADIATHYGSLNTLENRITSISTEKTKSVLSSEKAMDIIANRAQMSPAVEEAVKAAIGDSYYVIVITVVLTDITFTDAFELAVEEKMIAEQAKLKAEYENQTKVAQAEAEAAAKLKAAQAEIDIAQAQADAKLKQAEAQIKIAEAEAEAKLIAAVAESEANAIRTESITPEILEKMFYETWNGEMPKVMGGADNVMLRGSFLE
jgi:regulator of protease activity HflC (stomatin/prohibitin superfamily)